MKGLDADLLSYLTPQEFGRLRSLLASQRKVWAPDPDNHPQCMAYESKADVIGFGGAAGGGKTDLAIGLALTRHRRVQFFRREGTEVTAIVDRVAEVLKTRNGLGGKPPIWRNPTPTCEILEFCSVPNPGDETKHQGRPKDLLVFDEASNFLEKQVRFLMGWVRSTDPNQRLLTLLTFNPPTTAEGRWVIEFFAPWLDPKHPNPAKPGELRWFAMVDGKEREVRSGKPFLHKGKTITPKSRTFIPSRVTDNKYLARTDYMSQLESLPEPLRSQMRYGDFRAGVQDDPYQVIPTRWVEAAQARWKRPDRLPPMDAQGVDVAMGGDDDTVIQNRHGMWFDEQIVRTGKESLDGPTIAGWCVSALRDDAVIHIDILGVGAEPYAHLMAMHLQVIGVSFGETTDQTTANGRLGFVNVRAMLWWRMREALDPAANTGIALPPSKRLLGDLCAPKWRSEGSRIKVESREDIVKRIGRSLDCGTAAILALIDTPKAREMDELQRGPGRRRYDPLKALDEEMAIEERSRDPLSRM